MIGKPKTSETRNFAGQRQDPIDDDGVMLIGSFNKIFEYSGGIFSDLFCAFRGSLGSARRLVVGGYGFGDKGVNQLIVQWLRESVERKLIIVHKDYKDCGRKGRMAVQGLFSKNASQIVGTDAWFEQTSLADLRSRF